MLLFGVLGIAVGLHLVPLVRGNVYVTVLGCSSRGWLRTHPLIEVIIHIVVVVMARVVATIYSLGACVVAAHRVVSSCLSNIISHQEAERGGLILLLLSRLVGRRQLQLHRHLLCRHSGLRQLECLWLLVLLIHKVAHFHMASLFGVVRRVVDLLQNVGHVRRLALLVLEREWLRLVLLYEPVVFRSVLIVKVVHKLHCTVCLVLILHGLLRVRLLMLVLIAALAQELRRHRLGATHLLLFWLLGTVLGFLLVLSSAFNA